MTDSTITPLLDELPSHLRHLNLDHLARDTVIFVRPGVFTHDEVYGSEGYNLTPADFAFLDNYPPYQLLLTQWEKKAHSSSKSLPREQARVLFASNIRNLHIRLQDPKTSAGQVISALDMLADIGDIKPKKDDNASGLTVVLDFGQTMNNAIAVAHNTVEAKPPLEHNQQTN